MLGTLDNKESRGAEEKHPSSMAGDGECGFDIISTIKNERLCS